MDSVLEEAIRLREKGLAIHFLQPRSKKPFENDWAQLPVKSVEDLKRQYRPGYNVGFRPGKFSPVGDDVIIVLDIDVRGGEKYVDEAYAVAKTLTGSNEYSVKSGSGYGRHVFYRCPLDCAPDKAATTLRESDVVIDGKPAWKVELLSTGKNVVLPPSTHPDTGLQYEWLNRDLLPIPQGILDRLKEMAGTDSWPEPEEIQTRLLPVPKLTKSLLPPPLAPWINDAATRMQCAADYIVGPSVVMASILIGTRCRVRPKRKDNWTVTPNLWGGIIGSPGMLKSPAMKIALAPLEELERKAKADFQAASAQYQTEEWMREAGRKSIKSEIEQHLKKQSRVSTGGMFTAPDPKLDSLRKKLEEFIERPEPTWRRYKTNDSTVEKVIELLATNTNGLMVFRDELTGFLAALDREDRPSDRAAYLEAWSGDQPYTSDRIGRGTVHAPWNCLSVLGGIQPDKLAGYLREAIGNYANDGLLQRFQVMLFPDEPKKWKLVDRKPNEKAARRAHDLFLKLADVDFETLGALAPDADRSVAKGAQAKAAADAKPQRMQRFFHFADDAQEFFNDWLTKLEMTKIRGDESGLMVQHLAKYRSLMPSLALIFHILDLLDSGKKGPISLAAAKQAAEWCQYLEHHARRIYGLAAGHAQEVTRALAAKIRKGQLASPFTERDIYRNQWSALSDPEQVMRACRELEIHGWIRKVQKARAPSGGRPSATYEVNPKIIAPDAPRGH